jgi:hypothetical protein
VLGGAAVSGADEVADEPEVLVGVGSGDEGGEGSSAESPLRTGIGIAEEVGAADVSEVLF